MNFVISRKMFRVTFKSFPYIQILNNIMSDPSNPPTAPWPRKTTQESLEMA